MRKLLWFAAFGTFGALAAITAGNVLGQQPSPPLSTSSDAGLTTLRSSHSVAETLDRFEAAVKANGWVVFTRIDHAAAAEAAGQQLRPRTVVIFGNPRAGTAPMRTSPTLAIDLPMRALVWQDDQDGVWLTYNSAGYVGSRIYARHGVALDQDTLAGMGHLLEGLAHQATE